MLHLVWCFGVWTLISTFFCWRLIAIAKQAVGHLQRLHQIPCNKCAYFTGDYRLKCTVNPMVAMSETAIDCRDFMNKKSSQYNNSQTKCCDGCFALKKCSSATKSKLPVF